MSSTSRTREAVLRARAICEDGLKVSLHLVPGTKEDTASCRDFLEDLRRRAWEISRARCDSRLIIWDRVSEPAR